MVQLTQAQITKVASRKLGWALHTWVFTGILQVTPHPYLRTQRLCWSSSAKRGTLVAHHTR